MQKSILKSKTFWINILMMLAAVLPELLNLESISIPRDIMALLILVVNTILRLITKDPIGLISKSE